VQHRLENLIGEVHLVNPLCCFILCVRIGVSGSSVQHGDDLVLNA